MERLKEKPTLARKPRLHVPGGTYHVVVRGNNRQNLFVDDRDRGEIFRLIGEGVERFAHRIHAFCCMTNHVHLLAEVDRAPLSRIVHNLCFRYARWFNQRYGRSGHHFERRYRALLVESDSYLLELVRYIHRNPVRAGLSKWAEDYPWSSHRAYLGRSGPAWLTTTGVLRLFSDDLGRARTLLLDFVNRNDGDTQMPAPGEDPLTPGASAAVPGFVVCAPATEQEARQPSFEAILAATSSACGLTIEDLRAPGRGRRAANARAVAAALIRENPKLSLQQLSHWSLRSLSTLSEAATALTAMASAPSAQYLTLSTAREQLRELLRP